MTLPLPRQSDKVGLLTPIAQLSTIPGIYEDWEPALQAALRAIAAP